MLWFNEVEELGVDNFYTVIDTFENHYQTILNFFVNRATNANAESFNAALNLKANYIINSVPLGDLGLGRSFTANNTKVNCLLNIEGTPGAPDALVTVTPGTEPAILS